MELSKYAAAIKAELTMELSKIGSSLAEFEQGLQTINTGEGVFKVAADGGNMMMGAGLGNIFGSVSSIPEYAFKTSLAGGALAGLSASQMSDSVSHVNDALKHQKAKVDLVRRLTAKLRAEHGLQ
jgi:hypothetical protein